METKTVMSPGVKGLIISLVLIVFSQVTIAMDQMQNKALGWVSTLLFVAAVIWGCISYAKQKDHNVTFGNVFGHGFKITAAVAAIMAVYMILLFMVIDPGLKDISLQEARAGMEKRNMSESQIDDAMAMSQRLFLPFAIGGAIVVYAIVGCIASLIGAAAAKKNPPQQAPF